MLGDNSKTSKGDATPATVKQITLTKEIQESPKASGIETNITHDEKSQDESDQIESDDRLSSTVEIGNKKDLLDYTDLNGSFRLEKNVNFQKFLAAQGVN